MSSPWHDGAVESTSQHTILMHLGLRCTHNQDIMYNLSINNDCWFDLWMTTETTKKKKKKKCVKWLIDTTLSFIPCLYFFFFQSTFSTIMLRKLPPTFIFIFEFFSFNKNQPNKKASVLRQCLWCSRWKYKYLEQQEQMWQVKVFKGSLITSNVSKRNMKVLKAVQFALLPLIMTKSKASLN